MRRRRRLDVVVQQSDEEIDAVAWARRYVLAVLRLGATLPLAGPSSERGSGVDAREKRFSVEELRSQLPGERA